MVMRRGNVACGIDPSRPDYVEGEINFDADLCHAVAAALFDNPDAVEFRTLDADTATGALISGEIDVYVGPISAESPAVIAGPPLFADATGALARNDVNIRTIGDMKFATICLIQESVDERLFNQALGDERVTIQPFRFRASDYDSMYSTYDQGRCDAVVDDRIRLAQRLPALSVPHEQAILDLALTRELRGLLTANDDVQWMTAIYNVGAALIHAEEHGIASDNLEDALASEDPVIREFLGAEGNAGQSLSDDFATRIVRHVGNYAEIYTRHYPDLPRGPNALLKDGGMIAVAP